MEDREVFNADVRGKQVMNDPVQHGCRDAGQDYPQRSHIVGIIRLSDINRK